MFSSFAILWFFLPAALANSAPLFAIKLFGAGTPVRVKWFGSHKTWQGIISGTVVGFVVYLLQRSLAAAFPGSAIALVEYSTASVLLGAAFGFGALMGDLVKSFFKRRIGVRPGAPWIPFDQIDYCIGGLLFSLPFVALPWQAWILVPLFYGLMSIIMNRLAYALGFRETKI